MTTVSTNNIIPTTIDCDDISNMFSHIAVDESDSEAEDARQFATFRDCEPLHPEEDDEESEEEEVPKRAPKGKKKPIKFLVASGRIGQLKEEATKRREEYAQKAQKDAFDKLGERINEFSTDGKCTTPCRNIAKDENGNRGVCERAWCAFSHSWEDHKDRLCKFDLNCRNGNNCKFRHTNESRADFYKRTGKRFDLPDTSEAVRKPKVTKRLDRPAQKVNLCGPPPPPPLRRSHNYQPPLGVGPFVGQNNFPVLKLNVFTVPPESVTSVVELMKSKGISNYTIHVTGGV